MASVGDEQVGDEQVKDERDASSGHEPGGGARGGEGLLAALVVGAVLALVIGLTALALRPASRPSGPTTTREVALGDLFVEPGRVEVPRGSHLLVDVANGGDLEHDLTLQGETGTGRIPPGATQVADFGVIDGDTQAWCTVPGHREAGMVLDIVAVEPPPPPPDGAPPEHAP